MWGRKEMFFKLNDAFNSEAKFGNDTIVSIKGRYKIFIKLKDESQNFISAVLCI